MKISYIHIILFALFIVLPGYTIKRIDYRDGRYNNVCKDLKGDVLLYYVFIDSKETAPWTEFDIRSTIDSIHAATRWLQVQAGMNNVSLHIIEDYYIGAEYTTLKKNLPEGTVYESITKPSLHKGIEEINDWADYIAKRVGNNFEIQDKEGIPEIKNPRNKERLIALLRDRYNVESVALLFLVNNYYRSDISVAVNTLSDNDVEFAIVSYKYPSDIAHSFLSLFGAAPMYESLYRKNKNKIKLAQEYFPDDVMQDPYARPLNTLKIGPYTQYLIGWTDELDPEYQPLLTDRIINF
ncbi:MAG TPA: hypothetical protein VE912_14420 [Bacteroidales bacterium]|nr:hypothetical protein [Bacteroidales bacterium]